MSKFNIGDSVRLLENYGGCIVGEIGEIIALHKRPSLSENELVAAMMESGKRIDCYTTRLELIKANNLANWSFALNDNYEYYLAIVKRLKDMGYAIGEPMCKGSWKNSPLRFLFVTTTSAAVGCYFSENYGTIMGHPKSTFVPMTLDKLFFVERPIYKVTIDGKEIVIAPEYYAKLKKLAEEQE